MKKFLFLAFIPFMLSAEEAKQVIVDQNVCLKDLYIAPFKADNSQLAEGYLQKIEEIFHQDFCCNGLCALTESKGDIRISGEIIDNNLEIWVKTADKTVYTKFDPITLKGDLDADRKQIHLLADSVYKTLFNKDGIASSRILFTQKNGYRTEIVEADYDGFNAKQVTLNNGFCTSACYLPTEAGMQPNNFLFVSYQTGLPKIYLGSTENTEVQRVIKTAGSQTNPSISKDGQGLVFIGEFEGVTALCFLAFDPQKGPKGEPTLLYDVGIVSSATPAISPDGTEVAFVSNQMGTSQIYVLPTTADGKSIEGTIPLLISSMDAENSNPSWSPDGKKIAYISKTEGNSQIWVYDVKSQKRRQLTQGNDHKEHITWAPNGLHLLYNSTNEGISDLYLINLNQPDAFKITTSAGDKKFPSFTPG